MCLALALDPCLIYDTVSSDEGMAAGSGTSLVSPRLAIVFAQSIEARC